MKLTAKIMPALTIALLALTACNSEQPEADTEPVEGETQELNTENDPAPSEMTAGQYELTSQYGAQITIELPAESSNELFAEVEEYREEVQAEPITYLIADVDNREGEEQVSFPELRVYDEQGTQYDFETIDTVMFDWYDPLWETDEALYDRGWEIGAQDDFDVKVNQGATGLVVLAYDGDDLPDQFTRVAALPHGIAGEEEAYPAEG